MRCVQQQERTLGTSCTGVGQKVECSVPVGCVLGRRTRAEFIEDRSMDSKACTRTKKDLIEKVAEVTGQSRSAVKRTIQVAFDHIVDELAEGNRLEFRDFGVFVSKYRPGRIAQNPKTLEPVYVPPRRTVKFKPSRSMRERLKIDDETTPDSEAACNALRGYDALHVKKPIEVSVQESAQASSSDRSEAPMEAITEISTKGRVEPSVQTNIESSVQVPAHPPVQVSNVST